MHALILAGGFATRLWPLTEHRAKPLLLLDGRPIIDWIVDIIPSAISITIVTNAQFTHDFQNYVTQKKRDNMSVYTEPSACDATKRGALRAISDCIQDLQITDDIALLAGDNILQPLSFDALQIPDDAAATVLLQDIGDCVAARKFGVAQIDPDTRQVLTFEEKPKEPKSSLISTGFFSFSKDMISDFHICAEQFPDNMGHFLSHLLQEKYTVHAHIFEGTWFDIGSFETYLEAHKKLSQSVAPPSNRTSGTVWVHPSAQVTNCVLHDCIVYGDAVVQNCRIVQSIIDQNCSLKGLDIHGKLIRQGTHLTNNSEE